MMKTLTTVLAVLLLLESFLLYRAMERGDQWQKKYIAVFQEGIECIRQLSALEATKP